MKQDLTIVHRQRLQTIWEIAQTDTQYKEMLLEIRELEKQYEAVLQKLDSKDYNIVCDYVSQCEGMNWRILEIVSQQMIFRFEKE